MKETISLNTLPDINFVAGERQEWGFVLSASSSHINDYTVNLSVINYVNKYGTPTISKLCTIKSNGSSSYIAIADILPIETLSLYGKYLYQLTIIDPSGEPQIPFQGHLFITKNINKPFIQDYYSRLQ